MRPKGSFLRCLAKTFALVVAMSRTPAMAGKLLHCSLPPGAAAGASYIPLMHDPVTLEPLPQAPSGSGRAAGSTVGSSSVGPGGESVSGSRAAAGSIPALSSALHGAGQTAAPASADRQEEPREEEERDSEGDDSDQGSGPGEGAAGTLLQTSPRVGELDEADLDLLLGGLGAPVPAAGPIRPGGKGPGAAKPRPQRPEHKLHKKQARSKGDRGQVRGCFMAVPGERHVPASTPPGSACAATIMPQCGRSW